MCGIAGLVVSRETRPPALSELEAMVAVLGHRGPDGYGLYRDARAGLGHARLSIIDLAGGAQPMCNEDESLWVTFNGEIFNYVELRAELEALGHVFRTRSDTEAIVHAFEQWGEGAWARFNGQFAVALWDARRKQLVLARDQFGIVPLFYACGENAIVFASEVKALFAAGRLAPKFDPAALVHIFTRWAVPAPGSPFAGVACVAPGHAVTITEDLGITSKAWWQPDFTPRFARGIADLDEATDALEERLKAAVAIRLRADVPVGAYLSGGLDSSLVTALIQRSRTSHLETFSIRFEDAAFDETPQQRRMVEQLQTRHHDVLVSGHDIARHFPQVVKHCETPLLRTSPVPLFLLSDLVRGNGTKVVLTGEGADELFAGYSIFKEDAIRRFWARSPSTDWRSALLSRVHHYVGDQHDGRMWKQFFRKGLTETDNPFYSHGVRWANTAWTTRFLKRDLIADVDAAALESDLEPFRLRWKHSRRFAGSCGTRCWG
ncbi:MAG: asparagine synthase (glutamine-hydrolyzing), partial [Hyphomicrobiales bacterium]